LNYYAEGGLTVESAGEYEEESSSSAEEVEE